MLGLLHDNAINNQEKYMLGFLYDNIIYNQD